MRKTFPSLEVSGPDDLISTSSKDVDIVWINLREEPIIFINSTPHVLRFIILSCHCHAVHWTMTVHCQSRDANHPFRNLESFEGIAPGHLEEMEQRLKEDLLLEYELYGGKILVHDETELHQVPCSFSFG